jgi:hypothetical protein
MLQQLFRKYESCERRGYMNLRGFMKLLKFIGLFADVEHQFEFTKYSSQNRVQFEGFVGALRDCFGGDEIFFQFLEKLKTQSMSRNQLIPHFQDIQKRSKTPEPKVKEKI